MIRYDDIQAEIRSRKRARWIAILASEPATRGAGRRPRDPEQERILLRLDRARIARRDAQEPAIIVRIAPDAETKPPGAK